MPKIFVLSGSDVGKSFDVAAGAVFGRAEECAVRLTDASVSRHHARLELDAGRFWVVDTQSRNGVRVGVHRVERAPLEDGAEFQLGEVSMRFRAATAPLAADEPHAAAAAPPASVGVDEIELEGDWTEPAPRVAHAPIAAAAAPAAMPTQPARPARPSALQRAAAAAAGRAPAAAHNAAPNAASSRSVLQYNRVEDRDGFLESDMGQQPLWVRTLLTLVALALFAALFWAAFRGTAYLKNRGEQGTESSENPDAR